MEGWGVRESFQFVIFFTRKIEEAGLSSILSTLLVPDVEAPYEVIHIRAIHSTAMAAAHKAHKALVMQHNLEVAEFVAKRDLVMADPMTSNSEKATAVKALGARPKVPEWETPETKYSPAMAAQFESFKKEARYQNNQATHCIWFLNILRHRHVQQCCHLWSQCEKGVKGESRRR